MEASYKIGGRISHAKFADKIVDLGNSWVRNKYGNVIDINETMFNESSSGFNSSNPTQHMFITTDGQMMSKEDNTKVLDIYKKSRFPKVNNDTIMNFKLKYNNYKFLTRYNKLIYNEFHPAVANKYCMWMSKMLHCINGVSFTVPHKDFSKPLLNYT